MAQLQGPVNRCNLQIARSALLSSFLGSGIDVRSVLRRHGCQTDGFDLFDCTAFRHFGNEVNEAILRSTSSRSNAAASAVASCPAKLRLSDINLRILLLNSSRWNDREPPIIRQCTSSCFGRTLPQSFSFSALCWGL